MFGWPSFKANIVGSFVAVALFPYTAQRDDELDLERGDWLCVWDRRCSDWTAGVNLRTGRTGYYPTNQVKIVGVVKHPAGKQHSDGGPPLLPPSEFTGLKVKEMHLVRASEDYTGTAPDGLTLRKDDVVAVLETKQGWSMGVCRNRTGFFPCHLTTELNMAQVQRQPSPAPVPKETLPRPSMENVAASPTTATSPVESSSSSTVSAGSEIPKATDLPATKGTTPRYLGSTRRLLRISRATMGAFTNRFSTIRSSLQSGA